MRIWHACFFNTHDRLFTVGGTEIIFCLNPANANEIEQVNRYYYQKAFKKLFLGTGTFKDHHFKGDRRITKEYIDLQIANLKSEMRDNPITVGASFLVEGLLNGMVLDLRHQVLDYIEILKIVYAVETFKYVRFLNQLLSGQLKRIPDAARKKKFLIK